MIHCHILVGFSIQQCCCGNIKFCRVEVIFMHVNFQLCNTGKGNFVPFKFLLKMLSAAMNTLDVTAEAETTEAVLYTVVSLTRGSWADS
jgi:hypothetical protein